MMTNTRSRNRFFGSVALGGVAYLALSATGFVAVAVGQTSVSAPALAPLEVPARTIPVPNTVSPDMQKIIGAPLRANWNIQPKSGDEWKPVAEAGAAITMKNVPGMRDRLKVNFEPKTERLHNTMLNEFYRVAFRKRIYETINQLQADLDAWVAAYNEARPHQGRWCYGKTPMRTFLDTLPIAKEKSIQAA